MGDRPWFKMYPSDLITGALALTAEEKGFFVTVLCLIYDRGRAIDNDAKWHGRAAGCSTRRAGQLLRRLVELGKLTIEPDGCVHSPRAKNTLENGAETQDKPRENSTKIEEKIVENRNISSNINELDSENTPLRAREPDTRVQNPEREEVEDSPPKPPADAVVCVVPKKPAVGAKMAGTDLDPDFCAFWHGYPRKDGKGEARRAWRTALGKADAQTILDGCRKYPFNANPRYVPMPATWLNGERWLAHHETDMFDPVLRAVGLSPADFDDNGEQWGLLQ